MVTKKELQRYFVELVSECFGTCVLIFVGESGIANYKFARQFSHSTLPISISFAAGVYIALMISGPISGAHINPAVSLSLLTVRKLKALQCLFYIIGQVMGAFIGAVLVYFLYLNQFNEFDGGLREMTGENGTGDIFFTMPGKGVPHWNAFVDQLLVTALLMIFIMALTDDLNEMKSEVTKPFGFVLVILGITCAFSINAGAALNPARDLGPRLFGSFIYGWKEVFRIHNYFFSIPIVGPIVGAIIGVWIYVAYSSMVRHFKTKHTIQIQQKNSLEII